MSRARDLLGWIGAGTVTAGLFAGVALAALRVPEMPTGTGPAMAVALDLSVGVVAAAPALIAEGDAPSPKRPPQEMPAPNIEEQGVARLPTQEKPRVVTAANAERAVPRDASTVQERARMDVPLAAAQPVLPAASERSVQSLDTSPRPQARPEQRLATRHRPYSDRPAPEQPEQARRASEQSPQDLEPKAVENASTPAAGAQQAARPAEERRAAGGQAAARYGDLVMRQIAGLRRETAPTRGVVTVGFEIGADGGLRRVAVVASSGSEALDRVAVEHIRRAGPFPPPPQGAMTRFAFEFVGR